MTRRKPLVSVVTITYNHEQYIETTLKSILSQKRDGYDLELIIADDKSTDKTPELIRKYSKKYPEIVSIIRDKNVGIQNNLIDALRRAKGDYIALCEGDDYWTNKNKLALQVSLLENNKTLNICFHPTRVFFDNKYAPDTKFPEIKGDFNPVRLMSENFIPTNSVMYRRRNYETIQNDFMPFDWYLHGYHISGGEIGFINKVMSAYRRHEGGAWWTSHSDTKLFWAKYGPEMMRILNEFKNLYRSNKQMLLAIEKGEFRIINEMLKHEVPVDTFMQKSNIAAGYANNALEFIKSYYVETLPRHDKTAQKASKLQEINNQKTKEIKLLKQNLKQYIDIVSELQNKYDSLRSDLKNPVRIAKRVTKRFIGK